MLENLQRRGEALVKLHFVQFMGLRLSCYKSPHQIYNIEKIEGHTSNFNKPSDGEGSQMARYSFSAFLSRRGSLKPSSDSHTDISWLQTSDLRFNKPPDLEDSQYARYSHSGFLTRPTSMQMHSRAETIPDGQWALRAIGSSIGTRSIHDSVEADSPRNGLRLSSRQLAPMEREEDERQDLNQDK